VLAVGLQGEVTVYAFGRPTYESDLPGVLPETIYDADALTMPVVTSTSVAMLAAANRIGLDTPVARYIPEFAEGPQTDWRKKVIVRHLLTHTSGLPATQPYYRQANDDRSIMKRVFAEPLESEPGARYQFSRLGYFLLGEIVERITGKELDAFAAERIFIPLGMDDSTFKPSREIRLRIAPTVRDADIRHRLLRGEVWEANTWALGGVSGASGLFTTAENLAVISQLWLNGGIYAHRRILSRRSVEQFTAGQKLSGSVRSLGWEAFSPEMRAMVGFSEKTFGHDGATGTSLWVDPDKQLFIVLLTNAAHPEGESSRMSSFRQSLYEAVLRGLGFRP
jgi:CubicO group peptidase (beta-lactamase class C family)